MNEIKIANSYIISMKSKNGNTKTNKYEKEKIVERYNWIQNYQTIIGK